MGQEAVRRRAEMKQRNSDFADADRNKGSSVCAAAAGNMSP